MAELAQVLLLMAVPAALLSSIGYLNRRDARVSSASAVNEHVGRDR